MSFCPRISSWEYQNFQNWDFGILEGHNLLCRPLIEMKSKEKLYFGQGLSKNMWHAICTHLFQGDSHLLMGESQIGTLTPDPSFGHNLCFKYSNWSCEPILNIYVSRNFQ
jgi:hypothetical protein